MGLFCVFRISLSLLPIPFHLPHSFCNLIDSTHPLTLSSPWLRLYAFLGNLDVPILHIFNPPLSLTHILEVAMYPLYCKVPISDPLFILISGGLVVKPVSVYHNPVSLWCYFYGNTLSMCLN